MLKTYLTALIFSAVLLLHGGALVIGDAACGAPVDALQHAAMTYALNNGKEVSFQQIPPSEAMSRLHSGVLDMLLIERRFVPDDPELVKIPFAAEALVCYVCPENPLQNLSRKDILKILCTPEPDWAPYLGLRIKIQRIALKKSLPAGGLIRRIFGNQDFAQQIFYVSSNDQLFKFLNSAAIGFAPYQTERPVDALAVKVENVLPDRQTIAQGKYPLTMRYDLVLKKKNSQKLHSLLKMLFQEKYREQLENSSLLPLSIPFRMEPL